ncbi:hypothetical protein [Dehalobacter sp. 14DCB1]|uniref:hypothetical protein n=1 Tax=Dehalobacter sp. 14DCB1 TaxID=2070227 RepID=UPI001043989F|nr:hypothetical protein [Dehalobacter sp. 14DCB1]TCX53820.1 hypothetical protein C1I36_03560 [Dehalobacter sp. 14DCB1]
MTKYKTDYYFKNKYITNRTTKADPELVKLFSSNNYFNIPSQRSGLDRVLDAVSIGNYLTAGIADALVKKDLSVSDAIVRALRAANPFGEGYENGEYHYSQVLEDVGWKPESTGGRIAKGVVGFIGDVLLDPTTYLTGGASALLRGTGKTGLKLTHTADAVKDIANAGGMTKEIAIDIISKSGKQIDNIDEAAEKFVKAYNKVAGVRSTNADLTFGPSNLPFGEKVFGKDKRVTLAKAKTLEDFGEATLAPHYARLRDSIYGSQLGKFFSTKSSLYQASKTRPDVVYKVLDYAEHTRGLKGDKIAAEKAIRDYAAQYDLTPDDTRQIIELMQDKSKWSRVAELVKFMDTREAKLMQNEYRYKQTDAETRLSDLENRKAFFENTGKSLDEQIITAQKSHDYLKNSYSDMLKEYVGKTATDEEMQKYTDALLNKRDDARTSADLLEQYKSYKSAAEIAQKERARLVKDESFSDLDYADEIKGITDVDRVSVIKSLSYDLFSKDDMISNSVPEEYLDTVFDMLNKGKSKDEIKDYIDANKSQFSGKAKTIYSFIAKQFGYGEGKQFKTWKEVVEANQNNPEFFNIERDRKLLLRALTSAKNTDEMKQIMTDIENRQFEQIFNEERKLIDENNRNEFIDNDSAIETEFKSRKTKYKNNYSLDLFIQDKFPKGMKNIDSNSGFAKYIKQLKYEMQKFIKETFPIDEFSKLSEKQQDWAFAVAKGIVDNGESKFKKTMQSTTKGALKERLIKSHIQHVKDNVQINSDVKFSTGSVEQKIAIDEKIGKLQDELVKFEDAFKKRDELFARLIPYQQKYTIQRKYQFTEEDLPHIKTMGQIKKDAIKIDLHYPQDKYKKLKQDIADLQKEKDVIGEGGAQAGNVIGIDNRSDVPMYHVQLSNGKVVQIAPGQITHSVNKAIEETPIIKETIENFDELEAKVKARGEYETLVTENKTHIFDLQKTISDLQEQRKLIDDALNSNEFMNIDKLYVDLEKYEDMFASQDAFETAMRSLYGNEKIDEIVYNSSPKLYEAVLDETLNVNEKVREVATFFKNEFIKIGHEEVTIGKMKPDQFENMMLGYLPHIITPEGEELIRKFYANQTGDMPDYIKKIIPKFGADFGYGRKFNPFAKSRTLKTIPDGEGGVIVNPTIEQINNFFKPVLQGKNFFNENIIDIYLARAMKHNELMYDNAYMKNMMDTFGDVYNGEVKEGYDIVVNYGRMKESINDIGSARVSIEINKIVSDWLESEFQRGLESEINDIVSTKLHAWNVKEYDINSEYSRLFDAEVGRRVTQFIKETFPSDVRSQIYQREVDRFMADNHITGVLDDLAMPMLKINDEQYKGMKGHVDELKKDYLESILGKEIIDDSNVDNIKRYYKGGLVSLLNSHYYRINGKSMTFFEKADVVSMSSDEAREAIGNYLKNDYFTDAEKQRLNKMLTKLDMYDKLGIHANQVDNVIVEKANQARKLQIAKDQNRFLQMYDKFTHFVKLNQTTILPAFHLRNKLSNTYLNWLDVGIDAFNIDFQKNAFKAIVNQGKTEAMLTKQLSWSNVYDLAAKHDVINTGYFAMDVGVGAESKGILKNVPRKFDPTNTKDFVLYKKGAEIGGKIENQDRLIHFASLLKKGMSPQDAAAKVDEFLFNYSDLTEFEQSVMKRVLPYYTWLRKNAELQLRVLLENPKKFLYVSKVLGGVEGITNQEDRINKDLVNDFAVDWIQLPFSVRNPQGRMEPVLWNPNLPFMDLSRIPDITRPIQSAKELFSQTNPLFKTPIEQIANKNFFFDSPIVDEGDSAIANRTDHIASQFGAYGVLSGLATKNGMDLGLHVLNNATGLKFLSYDYDAYKAMKIKEILANQQ